MTPTLVDLDYVARTVWGEARGETYRGKRAVANVIYNRWRSPITWWGTTVQSVCLCPKQFSCWNDDDPNRKLLGKLTLDDKVFAECLMAAIDAIHTDETQGATHYYSTRVYPEKPPYWAVGHQPCFVFEHHQFFNDIG